MDEPADHLDRRLDRREVLRWIAAAAAAVHAFDLRSFGIAQSRAKGYGVDPLLARHYRPGDLWPLTLSKQQRRQLGALCDVILPADDRSPAASAAGVVDFIDEWVSAPYPAQQHDRKIILDGLRWLGSESQRRFQTTFAELGTAQQASICDDICYLEKARPPFKPAARFFAKVRNLTAGAFFSTRQGRKDVGYVGNVALAAFEGPPRAVRERLGLDRDDR